MSSQNGHVTSSVNNHIGTVTFFHPASNSLPGAILNELANSITAVAANPEVRVLILQSEGNKAFCAGASFDELIAIENMDQGSVFFSGFAKVINAMRTCGKLIIARVQGKAVGGGVGLASAADYVFATEHAAIKLSELATDKDLYCEMTVAEGAIADTANIDGKIYGFCSAMCKEEVVSDPQKYLSKK